MAGDGRQRDEPEEAGICGDAVAGTATRQVGPQPVGDGWTVGADGRGAGCSGAAEAAPRRPAVTAEGWRWRRRAAVSITRQQSSSSDAVAAYRARQVGSQPSCNKRPEAPVRESARHGMEFTTRNRRPRRLLPRPPALQMKNTDRGGARGTKAASEALQLADVRGAYPTYNHYHSRARLCLLILPELLLSAQCQLYDAREGFNIAFDGKFKRPAAQARVPVRTGATEMFVHVRIILSNRHNGRRQIVEVLEPP